MDKYYKSILVLCYAFAILLGSSYNLYLSYDYKQNPDCVTYINIANGNFEGQSLIRRYRIIVPFAAKMVSIPIEKVYYKLWENRSKNDDGPIKLGFFIVNMTLMAVVGLVLFHLGKTYQLSDLVCIFMITVVLIGGRWGSLFAAVPITDSLYLLVITTTFYAIKIQKSGYLILCLLIGFISKEAYIMLIPYVFLFSNYSKIKLILVTIIGLGAAFLLRHYIDLMDNNLLYNSLKADVDHVDSIFDSIIRISSVRGIGELFTVFGFFTFILILGFTGGKAHINTWLQYTDKLIWCLFPIAIVHALLSSEVGRMIYLFGAPLAILLGLVIQYHPFFLKLKR